MSELNLCVMGQFNIDAVSSSIGEGSYFRLGHNRLRFGGAVAHLGECAGDGFGRVTAIFPVGDDVASTLLKARASELFDDYAAMEVPESDSGVVLILFEDAGRRMVGPAQGSSARLRSGCLGGSGESLIASADVVVIDGYLLLGKNGPDVVCITLDKARAAGTMGVVDLVPHNLPQHVSSDVLARVASHADVLVGELRTIAPFFSVDENAADVSRCLLELNPDLTAILRYGESNIEINHVVSRDQDTVERYDGPLEDLTTFGYGDRKLVRQLVTLLEARQ